MYKPKSLYEGTSVLIKNIIELNSSLSKGLRFRYGFPDATFRVLFGAFEKRALAFFIPELLEKIQNCNKDTFFPVSLAEGLCKEHL